MLKAPLSRVAPLALALVVWVVVPTSAGADVPVTDVSWWTRSPAPPSVPAGGFSVGSAPDGSLSVAAIHVNVSHGASKANIQLTEASTGEGSQAGAIDVCRAKAEWVPANGGNMNQAPPADCASAVHLTRDAASGVWTGDLMPLLGSASGTVGLVIQPGPAPASAPGASASAYQASFAPPHIDGAVLTGSESSSSDSTSSSSSSSSFASSDSSSSSSFSSASPSLSSSSGSFSPGDLSASL